MKSSKKVFLAACIIVPFLVYCIYYYGMMIKNAPYRFTDFQSMVFKYGNGDSLINQYNSKTGDYQYVTNSGKLVKTNVKLSKDVLHYLHFKAADLGFWNFPSVEEPRDTSNKKNTPHFYIEFNYKEKSKKVLFSSAYNGPPSLKDANERLIKEIQKKLDEAEGQQGK